MPDCIHFFEGISTKRRIFAAVVACAATFAGLLGAAGAAQSSRRRALCRTRSVRR